MHIKKIKILKKKENKVLINKENTKELHLQIDRTIRTSTSKKGISHG